MNQLQSLIGMLATRWMRNFAGAAVASGIIWYLFPIVPALQAPLPRILAILAVLVVFLAWTGITAWRRRRGERVLTAGIAGATGHNPKDAAEASAEVALLAARMRRALDRLKRTGRRRLYDQPWFVLIGPPGSGKTTALLNSGLHFPLARDEDEAAVGGVGGTRLCDWWVAEEAVLIDTAGRYTTQDSDATIDRAGWHGFLDLLYRVRRRQPINGVIVVISLAEIADADAPERLAHARAVRRRLDEINERLQIRVPVYVIFSKADRLSGFEAYFSDLDTSTRTQVWGMTLPLLAGVEAFVSEFRLLLTRLGERVVERLQAERSSERRALIGDFPMQFASVEGPLSEFMTHAFSGSRLDPAPFLRGAYFTSAVQSGTSIDRLVGMLTRSFGIDQKEAGTTRPAPERSYFVSSLIRDVVLGEALLVSASPARARRQRILRTSGFAAIGVASLVAGLALWQTDRAARINIQQSDEAFSAYGQRLVGVQHDPIDGDDLPQLVPVLDAASSLPAQHRPRPPLPWLAQSDKLGQADALAYRRALQRLLLPRLLWRLEQQMRGDEGDPDALYAVTRVYLMLGGMGPLDPNLIQGWMTAGWGMRYPGTLNADLRARLLVHLDALLSEPLPAVTLDGSLVETARAVFSRVSPAARVYGRLRAAVAPGVPDWSPQSAVGPTAASNFAFLSGRPLSEGVPGLLTGAGFRAMLRDLPAATRAVAAESWVLGRGAEIPTAGPSVASLEAAVLSLWTVDAQTSWDARLGELVLAPFSGHDRTVQALYVLSSPQTPLRDMLLSITQALTLDAGHAANDPAAVASATFTAHFRALFDLVNGPGSTGGGASPLDAILRLINALDTELAAGGAGASAIPAVPAGASGQALLAEAERQPAPVSSWLRQMAAAGTRTLGSNAHSTAAASFGAIDGPGALCRSVVEGNFPFDPGSGQDAPIGDFARLFAPGGAFDSYLRANIGRYVDTSGDVWRPRSVDGVTPPVTGAALAAFRRAAMIRDAFFPAGSQPQVSFTLRPDSDNKATLTLGTVAVGGTNGAGPVSMTWPGADGLARVVLTADPRRVDQPTNAKPAAAGTDAARQVNTRPVFEADGPWALFRLLADGTLTPTDATGGYRLTLRTDGGKAGFTLEAGSARNPFGTNLLAGFRCPVVR